MKIVAFNLIAFVIAGCGVEVAEFADGAGESE
jgi:hypothetical protein